MNKHEFEILRDLEGKQITDDICFTPCKDNHHSLNFDKIIVRNTDGWTVLLNGHYKPATGGCTYNFVIKEAGGAVCRVDVNGRVHKSQGRTHKHDLQKDEDPRNNLPEAIARPDLEGKQRKMFGTYSVPRLTSNTQEHFMIQR